MILARLLPLLALLLPAPALADTLEGSWELEIGVSTWIGYSSNEGAMLSLAMIDPAYAEFGKEVTLVWGEPNGGTKKPTVEPHVQTEIKAIVSPVPYSEVARNSYADSWRATGKGVSETELVA